MYVIELFFYEDHKQHIINKAVWAGIWNFLLPSLFGQSGVWAITAGHAGDFESYEKSL